MRRRKSLAVLATTMVFVFVGLAASPQGGQVIYMPKTKGLVGYRLLENNPKYTMALESARYSKWCNLVRFSIALGGFGQVSGKFGEAVSLDLRGYDAYGLRLFNNSRDDWFQVNVYIKTGAGSDCYESAWILLGPGQSTYALLDLADVGNLNDVREIGFGISCCIGQGKWLADHIDVGVRGRGCPY